jgi:ATP-binding cassette subfamily C protein
MTLSTLAGTEPKDRRFGVFRVFAATSVRRQISVVGCLLLSGLCEGIGLASLVPIFGIATGKASHSRIQETIASVFGYLGLPLNVPILVVVLLAFLVLKAVLLLLAMNNVGYAMAEVATTMRLRLIQALLDARWGYFARQPIGRFTNAISGDAARAGDAYLQTATLMANLFQVAIYLALSLLMSWKLSLLSLGIGGAIALLLNRFVRMAKKAGRQQTRRTQGLVTRLSDALIGIKPLKAMGRHARLATLFQNDARQLNKALRKQVFSKQAARTLDEPLIAIFLAGAFYMAVHLWHVQVTELLVMGLLLARTVSAMGKAQQAQQAAAISESAYWSMTDTIHDALAHLETFPGRRTPTLERSFVFDRVSFAYGATPVLREASLEIPAGKLTTLIGGSGGGKTTLVDLAIGLFRPASGEIRLDGVPLSEIDLARWRSMVGYVPQEVILFHDTLLANLTLGDPDLTREDAEAALRAADAWDFVAAMPEGLDSIVGERGALLSGGQRQRIALARALMGRPVMLILDEATSALDPATEREICANVRALSEQRRLTVLAVSHHPAWVDLADRVYAVAEGRAERVPSPAALTAAGAR